MFDKLREEFPREAIHWRAQMVYNDKALALAYLDSRDVQDRLDEVCGPAGWQSKHYDVGGGKLACSIGILVNGEWVWKSDGAGDTQVEAEKGAFSSAFKRAAVLWGVGRYLYDMGAPWVPCETKNGKWKAWKRDPWDFVEGHGGSLRKTLYAGGKNKLTEEIKAFMEGIKDCQSEDALLELAAEYSGVMAACKIDLPATYAEARRLYEQQLNMIKQLGG